MISVVIPVYNGAKYIAQAVESVWAQDYAPLEVIVVDDGSTDETAAVLDSLEKQGPLRVIRQSNSGRSAARNRGIRESSGEWIAFLDADDYWLPGKLNAQFSALEKGQGDFAYSGTVVVDDDGRWIRERPVTPSSCLINELIWGNRFATPTVVVRKSLLQVTGAFDETLSVGEDWDLWLRLAAYGCAACVPNPLVAVRHGDWDGSRYALKLYEASVIRILTRFFTRIKQEERLQFVMKQSSQVWSSHYAVLCKSFYRHRNIPRALMYAARSIASHRAGLHYLLPNAKPSKAIAS